MLLVDDLLAAPLNGILWVFKEIQKAATEEQRARRDDIMAALSALYVALEQGQITDEVFDAREQALLDELDALDAKADADAADDEDEDDDEGDEVEAPRPVEAAAAARAAPAPSGAVDADSRPKPTATREILS